MKISYQWLKDFIEIDDQSPESIAEKLTHAGLEVEQLSQYEAIPGSLEGLVIGEVLHCEPHPNADKLKKTLVDVGGEQPLPIVCGAPNVAKGQKVVVALVGTTLYPKEGEPFTIKKAKIRGEVSEGMICAEDEIGLGTSHEGIMVLDTELPNGTPAAAFFKPYRDVIFEIGLTPNRADAASHLGVARDLRALLRRAIQMPVLQQQFPETPSPISVEIENPEACPRYAGLLIEGVKIAPSPAWLQERLKAIGLKPINNVVDITNYVMHELGQPMHAFDADYLEGNKIIVKTLAEGTPFVTLDGEERKLSAHDLMICDAAKPLAIAGVMGGLHSGIKAHTRRVFLESAYFSPTYVRKTSARHGLKTDASFRFERGTDPNMVLVALQRAAYLIETLAGGKAAARIIDVYPKVIENRRFFVKYQRLFTLLGIEIPTEEIKRILTDLDISIESETIEGLEVNVPPYRADVTGTADIAEELLRIYGFDRVPLSEHLHTSFISPFPAPSEDKKHLQDAIIDFLASQGLYEVITNSLTKPAYASRLVESAWGEPVRMLNYTSEEISVLRSSLLFSGLEVITHNLNRQRKYQKIFEFGKVYFKMPDGVYAEKERLGIWLTGSLHPEHWSQAVAPIQYHDLAAIVERLLKRMRVLQYTKVAAPGDQWGYGTRYEVNKHPVATIGLVQPKITRMFDIKQDVWFADIDWEWLVAHYHNDHTAQELPKFPFVRRDLSLILDKHISWQEVEDLAWCTERKLLKHINVFSVYEGNNIGEGKKSYAISFILQDETKTLTDEVIDRTMQKLMQAYRQKLGAVIRE
ncbi:phenylalanyl-tRNA synthetase beta chain [Thermonema lapsum]|uniref:Phenylalanine--tRNA ligase beta subunit n=1 Tax=Thermonema lapsum TaxID=28195 RepID=A0A846MTA4_9BACT|nr:phenylalanine--tRNA ligase subunit beta [Thermonema lapsum]NIK74685.1 phenylalanyl-tRNA synthetase beta chain [Thermonema lapsum]